MAEQNAYQVKVRVKHSDPRFKVKPAFIEGIVLAKKPDLAMEKALSKLKETETDSNISFEKFKVTRIKNDFIFG